MLRLGVVLVAGTLGLAGGTRQEDMAAEAPNEVVLGPTDGHELEAADLDRVQVGQVAPDFYLAAIGG